MKLNTDNRMGWILNIEKLRTNDIGSYITEYEIASDISISGVLNYDNGMILCGPMTFEKDHRGLYKYCLRIKSASPDPSSLIKQANKRGYIFKEGIPGELIALFSLYFGCRFYLLSAYSDELTQQSLKIKREFEPLYQPLDPKLIQKLFPIRTRNFASGLSVFLDNIVRIDLKHHQSLILASYHYARALKEFGIDEEMVFIRLVSAIEALSEWVILKKDDDVFNGKSFEEIIKIDCLSKEQRTELKNLFNVRKSRLKFIRFIQEYSKGFFKGGKFRAPHTKISKGGLEKTLDTIYNSRSRYLHKGEPMYLSTYMRSGEKWDKDPSMDMILDRRKFSAQEKLPYASWFHQLVRHCLLQFINEKSKNIN